jgi:serine protease
MHRSIVLALAASALPTFVCAQALPFVRTQPQVRGFANDHTGAPLLSPDRVVVRYGKAVSKEALESLSREIGLPIVDRGLNGEFVVFRADAESVDSWVEWFAAQPGVDYAERDPIASTTAAPTDPLWAPFQWNFYNYGALSNGRVTNFGIQAEGAWTAGATGTGVVVAVIDTGIAYENFGAFTQAPDLAGRTFVSPYDAVTGDGHANDENGHGTHCAGTIAQSTNNGIGCAGVAYNCTLMPIRALDAAGSGSLTWIANGVTWAKDRGAKVASMSLGGGAGSTALQSAITAAVNAGVTVCAATGNTNRQGLQYPAAYSPTIAVGATRFDGNRPRYSTYGTGIDVSAPGGDTGVDQNADGYADGILQQTFATGAPTTFGYYFFQGTSMATPHVAAVAALVRSVRPTYTAAQVRSAIETSCKDRGTTGYDTTYGFGIVNAALAITR